MVTVAAKKSTEREDLRGGGFLARYSLRRSLVLSFLTLAVIPIAVVSVVSYDRFRSSLEGSAENALRVITELKAEQLREFYDRSVSDVQFGAQSNAKIGLLNLLQQSYLASGLPLKDFVAGNQWRDITDEHAKDVVLFRENLNYQDVYLINKDGDILYTANNAKDIGDNVFDARHIGSRFTAAYKSALLNRVPVFSDLQRDIRAGGTLEGFMVAPLMGADSEPIGVIAIQLTQQQIKSFSFSHNANWGGKTYLVGSDLILRTPFSQGGAENDILEMRIDTTVTRKWQSERMSALPRSGEVGDISAADRFNQSNSGQVKAGQSDRVFTYRSANGNEVLGMYHHVDIAGVEWAVVAEIETEKAYAASEQMRQIMMALFGLTVFLVTAIALVLSGRIVKPVLALFAASRRVEQGDLTDIISVNVHNEIGDLADSFKLMVKSLKEARTESDVLDWFRSGQVELNAKMRGEQELPELCRNVITELAKYLNAGIGSLYLNVEDEYLQLMGSYAFQARKNFSGKVEFGDGVVGQVALERSSILLVAVPDDYIVISSGLGAGAPKQIYAKAITVNETLVGVIELGTFEAFEQNDLRFMDETAEQIGIAINVAKSRLRMQKLLEKTQSQAEELGSREEELRTNNEQLELQARELQKTSKKLIIQQEELKESNERLQVQQEELRISNEELEEKTRNLQRSQWESGQKNQELEAARKEIEKKATDLEMSSRYKTEFLANMSHELRTPLNSLLILSKLLAENKSGKMDEKQIEYAQTIYGSGVDLLDLINDILDLSKIESGKMDVSTENFSLVDFTKEIKQKFKAVAQMRDLKFDVDIDADVHDSVNSDTQKLGQILKNLLSNAFKFTHDGVVSLTISLPEVGIKLSNKAVDSEELIVFHVRDSGIGIDAEQQKHIFEAFQQADGTTSRKYGGTGLGLSISKELAHLLGGEIQLYSKRGEGSVFSVYIRKNLSGFEVGAGRPESSAKAEANSFEYTPLISPPKPEEVSEQAGEAVPPDNFKLPAERPTEVQTSPPHDSPTSVEQMNKSPNANEGDMRGIDDDRERIVPGKGRTVLVVEDDNSFADILCNFARERDYQVLHAPDGESGLYLADYYKPSAIVLDLGLPGMQGDQVLRRLKDNLRTSHIPIHIMSAGDPSDRYYHAGAVGFLAKPATMESLEDSFARMENITERPVKELLIVEDNKVQRESILALVSSDDLNILTTDSGAEAIEILRAKPIDCIILDLKLRDMSGVEVLEMIQQDKTLRYIPTIVYTGKELDDQESDIIKRYAARIIVKGARSPEKLLDDTALFLHRVEADLPEEQRRMIGMLHDNDASLKGRLVLLVDDDIRNVFSLSAILQELGLRVIVGKNGIDGLKQLSANPEIDLILMDIMMPEMDGYEAMKEVRKLENFVNLPIIALTAKAMKGDRRKCIAAGASDYLTKPVDTDKLISLLRVWMYR